MNPGKENNNPGSKTTGQLYRICLSSCKGMFHVTAFYPQIILTSLAPLLSTTDFLKIGETEAGCSCRNDGSKDVNHCVPKQRVEPVQLNA